jgi:hypothetical protein
MDVATPPEHGDRSNSPSDICAEYAPARRLSGKDERQRTPKRVITSDDWEEFVRIVGPDLQQAFMVDAWKLLNRFWRKL